MRYALKGVGVGKGAPQEIATDAVSANNENKGGHTTEGNEQDVAKEGRQKNDGGVLANEWNGVRAGLGGRKESAGPVSWLNPASGTGDKKSRGVRAKRWASR